MGDKGRGKEYASPVLSRQPDPSEAERLRIRELSRYYCAIPIPASPANTVDPDSGPPSPSISPDITLNALAQLAVHRFECDRSFVSLIDGERQHVIAEATKSISLKDGTKHRANDGIYLGVTTLDLEFGVCPDAVKLFTGQDVPRLKNTANMTADRSRFIVRDFSLEEYYKNRPYVKQWPYFCFYAEVPVYSPSGHVLGSFCVVDNKPRHRFSDEDVAALQEISDSISQHLENVRTVQYHQRSDRLVHGLKNFIKSRPASKLPPSMNEMRLRQSSTSLPRPPSRRPSDRTNDSPVDSKSVSMKKPSEDGSQSPPEVTLPEVTDSASSVHTSLVLDLHKRSTGADSENSTSKDLEDPGSHAPESSQFANAPAVAVKEGIVVSKRITAIFTLASELLRESMELEGVLFLDACRCSSAVAHPSDPAAWEALPTSTDPKLPTEYSNGSQRFSSTSRPCEVLGFASRNGSAKSWKDQPYSIVPESLLQYLIASFPNGEVFHLNDARGHLRDSARALNPEVHPINFADQALTHDAELQLLQHFPGADSVIFLPLWDWDKAQWLAGTFLWTQNRERALELEELHYFKIFSDSITSEVARVNWAQNEQSKSTFLSSISHELRSPLHGILASAELLSSTSLRTDQQELIGMLKTCGTTLLDTMNHLLDFTKINNLTTVKAAEGPSHKASTSSLASAFQLDALLEEVVETMYLGWLHSSKSTEQAAKDGHLYRVMGVDGLALSIVLRIDHGQAWNVQSITGAWRRIVMNILGNALKYTNNGFIEVCLSKASSLSNPSRLSAHLRVTDSGRGMSPEFLRHKLFSPFSQEDHVSEGLGLGLSMVHQLVTSLSGSIDVRSEQDVGTQIDIFIPIDEVTGTSTLPAAMPTPTRPTRFCLVGFNARPDRADPPTGMMSRESKRKLSIQSFFTHLMAIHSTWTVCFAETVDKATGDVIILEESILKHASIREAAATFSRMVLLGGASASTATTNLSAQVQVYHIPQPFSPQKCLSVLRRAANSEILSKDCQVNRAPAAKTAPSNINSHSKLPEHSPLIDVTKHVLVVDDNVINVKVLTTYMRKIGWTCDSASDGLMALNKYKESPDRFSMILMDISMPVMDGIAATRHIRTFEQQNSVLPVNIVAVTGVGSTTTKQHATSAGIDDYMIKPVSLQQLRSVVDNIRN